VQSERTKQPLQWTHAERRLCGVKCCTIGTSLPRPILILRKRVGRGPGSESAEGRFFFLAEGRISGLFRGANHPSRRGDGTFLPDFQGVIETDDGAEVLFDYQGYGRAYPVGRRQIVNQCHPLERGRALPAALRHAERGRR
jgi:hypothetical protein